MHTSVLRQAFPVDQETNNFVRRTSGRERASKSKKLREKIFSYGVFNGQKEYSQKFFISSYKTHSSALSEYPEKEEDKRQNGQN